MENLIGLSWVNKQTNKIAYGFLLLFAHFSLCLSIYIIQMKTSVDIPRQELEHPFKKKIAISRPARGFNKYLTKLKCREELK